MPGIVLGTADPKEEHANIATGLYSQEIAYAQASVDMQDTWRMLIGGDADGGLTAVAVGIAKLGEPAVLATHKEASSFVGTGRALSAAAGRLSYVHGLKVCCCLPAVCLPPVLARRYCITQAIMPSDAWPCIITQGLCQKRPCVEPVLHRCFCLSYVLLVIFLAVYLGFCSKRTILKSALLPPSSASKNNLRIAQMVNMLGRGPASASTQHAPPLSSLRTWCAAAYATTAARGASLWVSICP